MIRTKRDKRRARSRLGVSLIEVIACTALVAILIAPLAGVIRASGRSIASAQGGGNGHVALRQSLSWLANSIRAATVIDTDGKAIKMQLADGKAVRVYVDRGTLLMTDGRDRTIIAENVDKIAVKVIEDPIDRSVTRGIVVEVEMTDPSTRKSIVESVTISRATIL